MEQKGIFLLVELTHPKEKKLLGQSHILIIPIEKV